MKRHEILKRRINLIVIYVSIFILIFLSVLGIRFVVEQNYIHEVKSESEFIAEYIGDRFNHYESIKTFTFTLLNERLSHASYDVLLAPVDNAHLTSTLEEHPVDVFVYRDATSLVLYASDPLYLGTSLNDDCVLYDFFANSSESAFFLLDYSCPVVGSDYYVGLFRQPNGDVMQVGIHEDRYRVITETLSRQTVMEEIAQSVNIRYARLIDKTDYTYTAHSMQAFIGLVTDDLALIQAIDEERSYFVKHYHELEAVKVYCIAIPYYIDGEYMGVINIGFDTENMENSLTYITIIISILGLMTYGFVIVNITLSQRSQKRMHEAAYVDPITRLENRNAFFEYANIKLASSKERCSLVMINIQNFKRINDVYGYDIGDELLYLIGRRLNSAIDDIKVFRYHNDNFIVCLKKQSDREVIKLLDGIALIMNEPFSVSEETIEVTLSFGVHNAISYTDTVDTIIRAVSIAMHEASNTQTLIAFYDETLQEKVKRKQMILESLRLALKTPDQKILDAYYQPLYNAKTLKIEGVEMLCRMFHPKLGLIAPDEFIEVAEKEQLIFSLGALMQQKACDIYPFIHDQHLYISLNVSVFELVHDAYIDQFVSRLKKHSIPPSSFRLEVTESTFARDYALLKHRLSELSRQGFKIALDDFGTGYSSLSYLQEVHFDVIKIDQSFVSQTEHDVNSSSLVSGIIGIAHHLHASVTAEGIETQNQLEAMQRMGCDTLQGYYLAKPLPRRDFLHLLDKK